MQLNRSSLIAIALVFAAFIAGRWTGPLTAVKADSENPQIDVREIAGSTSLVIYYPGTKKIFVYQQPFLGTPRPAGCQYSPQLSTPGGTVNRQPRPAFSTN